MERETTELGISPSGVEHLEEMFSQFTVSITLLYAPYFRRKNVVALQTALNYCGSRHFLQLLIFNPEYQEERENILKQIRALQMQWEQEDAMKETREEGSAAEIHSS